MSRLIDADALLLALDKRKTYELADGRNRAYGKGVRDAMKDIGKQPTVDAAPVVHGHWRRGKSYPHNIYCSNCFRTYVPNEEIELWTDQTLPRKYCPECGALMDEVTES